MRVAEDYAGTVGLLGIALEHFGVVEYSPEESITPHSHGHHELCLVTRGTVGYEVEGLWQTMGVGDVCITRPGEYHWMRAASGEPWGLCFLNVRELDLPDLSAVFSARRARILRDCPHLRPYFDDILSEARAPRFASVLSLHAAVIRLLVEVARHLCSADAEAIAAPYSTPVTWAMNFIGESARYSTSVGEIASGTGFSPSWLAHRFKAETGSPLRTYLRSVLMERAKCLLQDGTDTVSEIAERLGFPCIACFSAFFRKHQGVSPTGYRQQVRP